ncbi:MAG: hypothetical protein OHK0045_15670 [Raineya sp.]
MYVLSLLILSFSSFSQKKVDDKDLVQQKVESYYKGYLNNDAKEIISAFDLENGHLKALQKDSITKKEFVRVYPMEQVAERWVNKKPFSNAQKAVSYLKILSIDILQNELAVVKAELKAGERLFIDYLSLYKVNEEWKIVNKVFVEVNPTKKP